MPAEAAVVYLIVLAGLKILYQFRSAVPWIGEHLSVLTAGLLLYVPFWASLRKGARIPVVGPGGWRQALSLFAAATLIIFPPFLLLNHFYQSFFNFHWQGRALTWPALGFGLHQLFLVALPEEYFFRGYLQPVFVRRFPKLIGCGPLSLSLGAVAASALFAFSHSIIHFQWWHFAIFFPSLVFAWLRERTGGLAAPVLFHTLSNIIVQCIGTTYR